MDAPRAAVAALLVLAAALPVAAGCGDDRQPAQEQLAWFDTPTVIVPPTLKRIASCGRTCATTPAKACGSRRRRCGSTTTAGAA